MIANIREKRSIGISPTKIDNDLLVNIGKILDECKRGDEVSIEIDADSKEIESQNPDVFADLAIPTDTYSIQMCISSEDESYDPVQIEIDVKRPEDSMIRVMGEDATWVKGVTERVAEEFEKKKLGYRHLAKYQSIRMLLSMTIGALLSYVGGFSLWLLKADISFVIILVAVLFYVIAILAKRFFDWIFPYFEISNENFMPKKVRKLALTILFGSGIVPTILFKWLGLS